MKELCPNCGADRICAFEVEVCGHGDNRSVVSRQCLRNQLETQTARALRFMRQVETDGLHWSHLLGVEKEKNTRLRGIIDLYDGANQAEYIKENTRLRGLLGKCVSFMDGAIEDGYANNDLLDLIDRINEGGE
jgi:hypothetical protein